jgi:uncharacterized membrane protein
MPLSAQENKTYLSGIKENARVHIKEGKKNRKLTKCGHLEDKTLAVVSLILSLL